MVFLFKVARTLWAYPILGRLPPAFLRHGLAMLLPVTLLGLTGLAGCGQKGPLFIAVPPPAVKAAAGVKSVPVPAAAAASAPLAP